MGMHVYKAIHQFQVMFIFYTTVVLFYSNTPFTSSILFVYLSVFSHHLCSHFLLSAATGSISVFVPLIKLEAIIA